MGAVIQQVYGDPVPISSGAEARRAEGSSQGRRVSDAGDLKTRAEARRSFGDEPRGLDGTASVIIAYYERQLERRDLASAERGRIINELREQVILLSSYLRAVDRGEMRAREALREYEQVRPAYSV